MTSKISLFLVITLLFFSPARSQNYRIIESNDRFIEIEFNFSESFKLKDTLIDGAKFSFIKSDMFSFRNPGEPWLPQVFHSVAIPQNAAPTLSYSYSGTKKFANIMIPPYPDNEGYFEKYDKEKFDRNIYGSNKLFPAVPAELGTEGRMRFARILPVFVSPVQYNPVLRELVSYSKVRVRIDYNGDPLAATGVIPVSDPLTEEILQTSVINPNQASKWIGKVTNTRNTPSLNSWYDPSKRYFKMFYNKEGVYRVTYAEMIAAGASIASGIDPSKIEVVVNGASVPLDVNTGTDTIFNSGDYIQFVAYKLPPSEYTRQNIYNTTNVMWITFDGDGTSPRYKRKHGIPSGVPSYNLFGYLKTDFYEKDSLYERLGYADDANRDHWYWDKATGNRGNATYAFRGQFQPFQNFSMSFPNVTMRVSMHGMTVTSCTYGHHARILFNDKLLGESWWSGQQEYIFERNFYISVDSFPLYPSGNYLTVEVDGRVCHPDSSDEIRVNWFEFTYFSQNRVFGDNYNFNNSSSTVGVNFYRIWQWNDPKVNIYIPGRLEIIDSVHFLNDEDKTFIFADTALAPTQYYCAGSNFYMQVDSIRADISSNLRNNQPGADLLVIIHSKFTSVADRYKNFRLNNWTDNTITNPRIKIVDIQDIYDEFSDGLLEPAAIRDYLKYSFENYQAPAPAYVALIGDMSYDYRGLKPASRKNYIPSLSHHSYTYGEAASDNALVCVAGDDVWPEMTIARLSIETVEEGNILLDKLENYPADAGKKWRETVLMLASGLNNDDEIRFGFNDASISLANGFVIPQGYDPKMIFRYPNRPEHFQYRGSTQEIREAINTGASVVNYYGHGGGYQWDLTFLNEDIYVLQNESRLPLVLSVTCYTAHFDNQDVFGEQFIKVPGKGSIGFFGSSGLTHWEIGKYINQLIFDFTFIKKDYISGRAVLKSKLQTPPIGYYGNQIALLTFLGDPLFKLALPDKPDFVIKNADITVSQTNPVIGDSVDVTIRFSNFGIQVNDSVSVRLSFSTPDTSAILETRRIKVFPNRDSLVINWKPVAGGLTELKAEINLVDSIPEIDYSDNSATYSLAVFNISEPSIIKPLDGEKFAASSPEFFIADIGLYTNKTLEYYIEIDTSISFNQPVVKTPALVSTDGVIKYTPTGLSAGVYFWRSRIYDGQNFGKWTPTKTFTLGTDRNSGYFISGNQLQMFNTENLNFLQERQTLALNTSLLPPKPGRERMISDTQLDSVLFSNFGMSIMTTDGKYLYIGNMFYWMIYYYGDSLGRTKIYKVGTGEEGTVAGQFYGEVPNFQERVGNTFTYFRTGHIYVPTVDPYKILKVDVETGAKEIVDVPLGLIDSESGKVKTGNFTISSDSNYIYCLAFKDSVNSPGTYRYTLNVYDPLDGMRRVASHYYPLISSYNPFTYFFVADGFFYPYENLYSGFMRRIRISDGFFEQEWIPGYNENPNNLIRYYGWAIDTKNNYVYGAIYRPGIFQRRVVTKFPARYIDAKGVVSTPAIGPAQRWKTSKFSIGNKTSQNIASMLMFGYNKNARIWDTLYVNLPDSFDMTGIDNSVYPQVKFSLQLIDSSFNSVNPIELRGLSVEYTNYPELVMTLNDLSFAPDSLLQGLPITMTYTVRNMQSSDADSARIEFFIDGGDSVFHAQTLDVKADSFAVNTFELNTAPYIFNHTVKAIVRYPNPERFTFNNILSREFFVARDSINPLFRITFDDKEIINGDIVSKTPEIKISLKDDSPLPLDTSYFTILYDNVPLSFSRPDINVTTVQYPNTEMIITWKPVLTMGRHTLDILAKDASGNFFDTTFFRNTFFVFDKDDIANIYNYPNPFKDDTYFTFELRGSNMPDEMTIRVYTIAGRLIREIKPERSQLSLNFNRIRWDGRDQDGNEIANGVYLYKLVTKFGDVTKTKIDKIVRVR